MHRLGSSVRRLPTAARHLSSWTQPRTSPARSTLTSVFQQTAISGKSFAPTQRRWINLHEYQAQDLMRQFGINVPIGRVVSNMEEAERVLNDMFAAGHHDAVVKAQVLAGGRGLGHFTHGFTGGIHVCGSVDDALDKCRNMLGKHLVTKQTHKDGVKVNQLYITERLYSRRELYIAFVMDRTSQSVSFIGSTRGGMNIETVAEKDPDSIIKVPIDPVHGLSYEKALEIGRKLKFNRNLEAAAEQFVKMYQFFVTKDCTQFEINPFVETPDAKVVCLDAKVNFDPNAQFRHADIFSLHDNSSDDPREIEARRFDLNFIGLDGNVGCLVNGAGLAMATMDVIKMKGGEPANFLDVGGGANEQQVYEALRIMNEDDHVHSILVNIFGGIMQCDVIASALIKAVTRLGMTKPVVVRLKGTNQLQAVQLIEKSGLRIIPAQDLSDAAQKAVGVATISNLSKLIKVGIKFNL